MKTANQAEADYCASKGHQFLFSGVAIATDFPGKIHYNKEQKVSFRDSK